MRLLLGLILLTLVNPVLADETKTETTPVLKLKCTYDNTPVSTVISLINIIKMVKPTGSEVFETVDYKQAVQVEDCSTLDANDPNYCIQLEGVWYTNYAITEYGLENFKAVYEINGTFFSDTFSPITKISHEVRKVVTIDNNEQIKIYNVDLILDPNTGIYTSRSTEDTACKVIEK